METGNQNVSRAVIAEKDNSRVYLWERADIQYYTEILGYEIVGYEDVDTTQTVIENQGEKA